MSTITLNPIAAANYRRYGSVDALAVARGWDRLPDRHPDDDDAPEEESAPACPCGELLVGDRFEVWCPTCNRDDYWRVNR